MKKVFKLLLLFTTPFFAQLTNGDFSTDFNSGPNNDATSDWVSEINGTSSKRWNVNGSGAAESTGNSGSADRDLYQTITLSANTEYVLAYDFTINDDGDGNATIVVSVGEDTYDASDGSGVVSDAIATKTETSVTGSSTLNFTTTGTGQVTISFTKPVEGSDTVTIDNVTVTEYVDPNDALTNADFSSDFNAGPNNDATTDWVSENNTNATKRWNVNSGVVESTGSGTADLDLYQTITLSASTAYTLQFDYTLTDNGDADAELVVHIGEDTYDATANDGSLTDAIASKTLTEGSGSTSINFTTTATGQVTLTFVKPTDGGDVATIDNLTLTEGVVAAFGIENGDFASNDLTAFTANSTWSAGTGRAVNASGTGSANQTLEHELDVLVAGTTYEVCFSYATISNSGATTGLRVSIAEGTVGSHDSNGIATKDISGVIGANTAASDNISFTPTSDNITNGVVLVIQKINGDEDGTIAVDNLSINEFESLAISNADFATNDLTDWTASSVWNGSTGAAVNASANSSSGSSKALEQAIAGAKADNSYKITFGYDITSASGEVATIEYGVAAGTAGSNDTNGVYSGSISGTDGSTKTGTEEFYFTPDATQTNSGLVLVFYKDGGGTAGSITIDDITIEEVTPTAETIGTPDANAPNIIVMMCDDVGPECFTPYGVGKWVDKNDNSNKVAYETPNVAQLASDGIRFKYAFNGSICTPSRVKIMTGRHGFRNYTKFKEMNANEQTIGHIARAAGYKTMIAGKWQLSNDTDKNYDFATESGFENFVLHNFNGVSGNRYANPTLWTNDTRLTTITPGQYWDQVDNSLSWKLNTTDGTESGGTVRNYGPDITSDYIVDFIDEHAGNNDPFFVYYPCILPHNPFDSTPDSVGGEGQSGNEYHVDMIKYIDKIVGKLMTALSDNGVEDNTLFIFTSDNGTNTSILSELDGETYVGGKGSMQNNGSWAPFIVKWPNEITGGQVSEETIGLDDVLPTVVEAMGSSASLPTVKRDGFSSTNFDGQSLIDYMSGATSTTRGYTFVQYNPGSGSNGNRGRYIRHKEYKYYDGRRNLTQDTDPNNMTGWYYVEEGLPNSDRYITDPENIPDQTMKATVEAYMQQMMDEGSDITNKEPVFDNEYVDNPITLGTVLSEQKPSLNEKITSSNPSTGNFVVEGLKDASAQVLVVNSNGETVIGGKHDVVNGTLELDLTPYQDGIYIVRIDTNEGVIATKVLKID